jgi:predicted PurR-regulated permease PerM
MNSPQLQRGVFLALLAAVTAAFLWVLMPFFGAVLWGVALAILFTPLYKWLLKKMRGKPNAAALSTLAICLFIVILPLAMVGVSLDNFTTVIRATVKGNVLVAIAQGALGGLIFWFLHVQAPLLWAVVMAFLSLLPAVGAAIVWAPVAIYFLVTGAVWQGVVLIAVGVFVIGLVDNFLRPVLVGKDTKMPDYVVLLSTVGGMALFGLNGFVIGPVVAALFMRRGPSRRLQWQK